MTGILPGVADAVVSALNAGTFSLPFQATRSYAGWKLKLEELSVLRVDVVPTAEEDTGLMSDGSDEGIHRVDVVVRKKLDQSDVTDGIADNDALDPLVSLVEEINRFFMDPDNRRVDATTAWVESRIVFPYVPHHLPAQFTGVARLGFHVTDDLDV